MIEPFYKDEFLTLYVGDVREVMKELPAGVAQACVTSPPYFGLRQYLFDGAVQFKSGVSDADRERVLAELRRLSVEPK